MALNKSKSLKYLGQHLFAIFCCIAATGLGLGMPAVYLAGCYIVIHGIQDWYIWKGYKYLVVQRVGKQFNKEVNEWNNWKRMPSVIGNPHIKPDYPDSIRGRLLDFENNKEYAEDKAFYDIIGLDRLLHLITIIILWGVFFL